MTSPNVLIGRLAAALRDPIFLRKMLSFGVIGGLNALVDLAVFLVALKYLTTSLVIANIMAWLVAVTGSYVLNSFITFAAESGRVLRWRDYLTFTASGILGVIANTTTVVIADKYLTAYLGAMHVNVIGVDLEVPLVAAKIIAIGAGFLVNFSMSHFVVFRKRNT